MNCPFCGAPLLEEDTYCSHCQAEVNPSVSPEKKTLRGTRLIVLVVLLFCVALLSIFYAMNTRTRLTGNWMNHIPVPNSDIVVHRQYEFTPFGIMSETAGDSTVKGTYKLQGNKILFTPDRNEEEAEEIEFRLTMDGKLYLYGDHAHPYTMQGFPYAAIFLIIGVVAVFAGSYILGKKILKPNREGVAVLKNEKNSETQAEEDSKTQYAWYHDVPLVAGIPAEGTFPRRHKPPKAPKDSMKETPVKAEEYPVFGYVKAPVDSEDWFVSVDQTTEQEEVGYSPSDSSFFQQGGDL